MSELLISDWVVELLEEWDAELPLALDFGDKFVKGPSARVTFMIKASVVGRLEEAAGRWNPSSPGLSST